MKINKKNSLFLFFIIVFCSANTGAEIVKGKKFAGEKITYAYKLEKKADQYFLVKQLLCLEMQEELEVYRDKKERIAEAAVVASIPMVMFAPNIGSAVFNRALAEIKGTSKKHYDNALTGRLILCGKEEPGSGEKLIIQTSSRKIINNIVSKSDGEIDLKAIAKTTSDEIYLNIFIKKEDSIFYLSTIYL